MLGGQNPYGSDWHTHHSRENGRSFIEMLGGGTLQFSFKYIKVNFCSGAERSHLLLAKIAAEIAFYRMVSEQVPLIMTLHDTR